MADSITFTYRPDLKALIVRWFQPVSDAGLRRDLEDVEREAQAHDNCCCWLLDIRRRQLASDVVDDWAAHTFFPRLPHTLGAPVRVAFLSTPMQLAQVVLGSSQAVINEAAKTGTRLHFFADEAAALAWLTR